MVRLAAVVSCGYVSYVDDLDATTRLRVRILAVKVSDTAEDPLDGGWVVAHHIGGFRHMRAIPGDRKSQHMTVKIREEKKGSHTHTHTHSNVFIKLKSL